MGSVVRKVLRLKAERPSLFASEIRDILLSQRLCDPSQVPSVSSINRILREAATATSSLATAWPITNQMISQHFFGFPLLSSMQMEVATPSTSSMALQRQVYDDGSSSNVVLDCSKATLQAMTSSSSMSTSSSVPDPKKRKKISYAIDDLLKKDDS